MEEINILRDNNQSMVIQISENVRMEQKINVQSKVIKELKEKLNGRSEHQNQEEELFKLVEEIKQVKDINEEKEIKLENVSKECEAVQANLKILKPENLKKRKLLLLMKKLEECTNVKIVIRHLEILEI